VTIPLSSILATSFVIRGSYALIWGRRIKPPPLHQAVRSVALKGILSLYPRHPMIPSAEVVQVYASLDMNHRPYFSGLAATALRRLAPLSIEEGSSAIHLASSPGE